MLDHEEERFRRFLEVVREGWTPPPAGEQSPEALEAVCLADFLATPDPPAEPLLGPLLARGDRLILAAATGEGKSTMVMWMVRAIVTGEQFLGWAGAGGRVLVIDAEQSKRDIRRLAEEVGLHDSREVDYLWVPDGLDLSVNAAQEAAIESILLEGDYACVVADPWYKLHAGGHGDEEDALRQTRLWDRWRTEHRFGLMVPHHTRKPPPGVPFTINEIYGSTAYVRGAEVIVGLQLLSDGYSRLHFFKDRAGELPVRKHWDLLFSKEEGFRIHSATATSDEGTRDLHAALAAAAPAGMTMKAMQELTGRGRDWINARLSRFEGLRSDWRGKHKWYWIETVNDTLLDRWTPMAETD